MTSFLDTLWTDIKTKVIADATYVESAVESVFTAEVAELKPIVEAALTTFAAAVAADPSTTGVVAAGAALWADLLAKVPGAAISTGVTTFITSITTGMAAAVAAATAPAPTVTAPAAS